MAIDTNEVKRRAAAYLLKRRKCLRRFIEDGGLVFLREHFETNLPCFQGSAGKYDPLDAMRRDAHREVILWMEAEAAMLQDNTEEE